MSSEPEIIINGTVLNSAQAMTVRVALESFFSSLSHEGLGDDECGKAICNGYMISIREIRKLI
jgi:hypothetical protein